MELFAQEIALTVFTLTSVTPTAMEEEDATAAMADTTILRTETVAFIGQENNNGIL